MLMDQKTKTSFDAKAKIFKAIAHPTRLFIVDELAKESRCVCEITAMVGADISTISKHLSILKEAGIVQDEKRGLQVFYSLKMPCIKNFIGCIDQVQKQSAKEQWSNHGRKQLV
jgi:DNA-binding transcriptional ArsR family regulator